MQLKKGTVDLVDDDNGLNPLTQSLSEHSLGLDTDTLNSIDHDQGTVGDTESCCDLGREIDVPWGVDQVDQESGSLFPIK